MSNTIGNAKDLDSSRAEALQGLFHSLRRTNDEATMGAPLSTDQVQRLSEKIKEILGDVEDRGQIPGALPSKLLNEDGLPIIDISEPVNDDSLPITSFPLPDQELTPFSLLSSEEKERRRRERDRIFDLLEEEERLHQLQEEQDADEERKEAVKKRKKSAKAELEQLKATRDLQKRMGQTLVRPAKGVGESRYNAHSNPQTTPSIGKKSVSFADPPAVEVDEKDQRSSTRQPDWGDVIPGRLCARRRIPLVATTDEEKHPMKMQVVERHPAGTPTPPSHGYADSDDESVSTESPNYLQDKSSGEENTSSLSNNGLSDDEPLEEGFYYDIAQHHREIALEYHKKRNAIGAEAAKAMSAVTLSDGYEQQENTKEQLLLSRSRADRMAAAYDKSHDPVSMSIGQTLVPISRQKSLRKSLRLGKLENNQLVGGESEDSGSEDETVREIIQMLKTGGIRNVGPYSETSSSRITLPQHSDIVGSPSVGASTTYGTKPSKFKLARGRSIKDTNTVQDNSTEDNAQSQQAISSAVKRRSFPINKPPPRSATETSEPVYPTVIDSPSFPATFRVSPWDSERSVSKFMAEKRR